MSALSDSGRQTGDPHQANTVHELSRRKKQGMLERDVSAPEEQFDLTNCEREPIHIPGRIQAHGVLLVVKEPELTVLQVSENSDKVIGIASHRLLQHHLATFFSASQLAPLNMLSSNQDMHLLNPLQIQLQVRGRACDFDGIVHRTAAGLILELEPVSTVEQASFPHLHHLVQGVVSQLQAAANLTQLLQITAQHVRRITGFDRVMIYRFHQDWHGEVIAEDKLEALSPYLGLHYPASDIPKQARDLYELNCIRLIANVNAAPAAILPTNNPLTDGPLDLSFSVLRSVSPIHIEYLKNMGVGASMSISLMKGGKLWGLISCHHQTPKYLPYTSRTACELLGQIISLQLVAKEELEDYTYKAKIKQIQARLIENVAKEEQLITGVFRHTSDLLNLVSASGAVIVFDEQYILLGAVPEEQEVRRFLLWLQENMQQNLFYTDCLARLYPEAENFKDKASGLLAISISKTQGDYILWFRPEVLQTVQWGGDPLKPVEIDAEELRLHPRTSFAAWKQLVHLTALPWKQCELEVVWEFRSAVLDLLVRYMATRRAEALAQLNTVLQRSNAELEQKNEEIQAFAYALAHDLRTPLSAIAGYAELLGLDPQTEVNPHIQHCMQNILKASSQMEQFIDDLLKYTRLGRQAIHQQFIPLHELIAQIVKSFDVRLSETQGRILFSENLPILKSDPTLLSQIFINLFDNALTYRRAGVTPQIRIAWQSENEHLLISVSDNGIGIKPENLEEIFGMFQRLHKSDQYPGTGIGLAVVKKACELLDGQVWIESVFGQGTTFWLKFPMPQ